MSIKLVLYIITVPLSLVALDSLSVENKFKKNHVFQAKILIFFLTLALSYLVVNFLYDIYLNSNFI